MRLSIATASALITAMVVVSGTELTTRANAQDAETPAAVEAPATDAPATEAPAAEAPADAAPVGEAPPAEAPAADAPASDGAAAAGGPAYVGTWAADASQCAVPQEQQTAPMIVTEAGFDQHEVHCSFKSVTPDGDAWKMSAECQVEGDPQPHDFSFAVSGATLTITDEDGTNQMQRCP